MLCLSDRVRSAGLVLRARRRCLLVARTTFAAASFVLTMSHPTAALIADCHFHYSTRFATKCVGCGVAILKQFVEVNRNQRDECWHPECYMIQKVRWAQQIASVPSTDRLLWRSLVLERQAVVALPWRLRRNDPSHLRSRRRGEQRDR